TVLCVEGGTDPTRPHSTLGVGGGRNLEFVVVGHEVSAGKPSARGEVVGQVVVGHSGSPPVVPTDESVAARGTSPRMIPACRAAGANGDRGPPVQAAVGGIRHQDILVVRSRVICPGHIDMVRVGVVHGDRWTGESVAVIAAVQASEAVDYLTAREAVKGADGRGESSGSPGHLRC